MCSCARIGLPAATRPTIGRPDGSGRRMPRDVPGNHLDGAFAGERFQMFLCRVRRLEAEFGRDVGAGRRIAGVEDVAADQVEHLRLAGGQVLHAVPVCIYSALGLYTADFADGQRIFNSHGL